MFREIEETLGFDAKRFLMQISPDATNDKLGQSAKVYKRGLTLFSGFLKEQTLFPEIKTLSAFIKAIKVDLQVEDTTLLTFPDRELLKAFVLSLEAEDYAAKSIRNYVGSVQALGKYLKVVITTNYSDLPPGTVEEENAKYPWDIEKVSEFIRCMNSPLHECLGVWFLQSALSNYDVLDLRYGKIKDQLQSGVSPICLNLVRHKTRKYVVKFRTFLGSLSIDYFNRYIGNKSFDDDDRLFKISSVAVETFFARRALTFLGKDYAGRNPCCPSSLRTAFRTFLTDAEAPDHYIEYWMGHKLNNDLAKTYINKSDQSWRQSYSKYEPVLTFKI